MCASRAEKKLKKRERGERGRALTLARLTARLVLRAGTLKAQAETGLLQGGGAKRRSRSGDRGMLVLLVVLLVPCALVSALVRCDETWSSTALAFAGSSALVRHFNAPPAAAAAAKASVIGAREKERASLVVTVREKLRLDTAVYALRFVEKMSAFFCDSKFADRNCMQEGRKNNIQPANLRFENGCRSA